MKNKNAVVMISLQRFEQGKYWNPEKYAVYLKTWLVCSNLQTTIANTCLRVIIDNESKYGEDNRFHPLNSQAANHRIYPDGFCLHYPE
jgi:hypothetical protein